MSLLGKLLWLGFLVGWAWFCLRFDPGGTPLPSAPVTQQPGHVGEHLLHAGEGVSL